MVQANSTKHKSNHSTIEFDPFSPKSSDANLVPSSYSTNRGIPDSPRDARADTSHQRDDGSPRGSSHSRHLAFSFSTPRTKESETAGGNSKATSSSANLSTWKKSGNKAPFPVPNISLNSADGTLRRNHKKSHSLIENKRLWKEVQEAIPVEASSITSSPKPLDVDARSNEKKKSGLTKSGRFNELFLPSLTKPRPTSLLTKEDDLIRTCESDPSAFQLALPQHEDVLVAARTVIFLGSYQLHELVMDLSTLGGFFQKELQSFASGDPNSCKSLSSSHRAVVERLLYSCPDLLEVKGYFRSDESEVLIIERQKNQFLVAFHVTEAHLKKATRDIERPSKVTIAKAYFDIAQSLSPRLFAHLDELSEESPFSDYVFAGHGTGAGLALLACYLYAHKRTSQRVAAYLTSAPKVGLEDFRMAVHSQPNLQVTRMDNQGQRGNQVFCHVGHCIRFNQGSGKIWSAKANKFASDAVSPRIRSLLFQRQSTAEEYVDILENTKNWPEDFHAQDVGEGVKGEDNEKRILT